MYRYSILFIGAFLMIGCANAPSITTSDGVKEGAPGRIVSVCYNASNATRQDIAALAREECPNPASGLSVWDHDSLFNNCPISKRNRVTFVCIPP